MYNMMPFADRSGWNQFFDAFERNMFPGESRAVPAFRTDIRELEDQYLLEADLPGFRKEDIDLEVKEGILTISAAHEVEKEDKDDQGGYLRRERRSGSYRRSFQLNGIEEDGICASYENGVLKLILPKQGEPEPRIRKISIR